MPGPVNGSMGNLHISSGTSISSSVGRTTGSLFEALDLAVTTVQLDRQASLQALGSPMAIKAGMARLERSISPGLRQSVEALGETDRYRHQQIGDFVETGAVPGDVRNDDILIEIGHFNESDSEQTPESRMRSVIDALIRVLGNAGSVTLRTGLIVTATSMLSDYAAFQVQKIVAEMGEDNSHETALRVIATALSMVGLGLILLGAVRDECAATATFKSRLGRTLMSFIFMGSFVLKQMTGGLSSAMLATAVKVVSYVLSRDVSNAYVYLQDNAGAASNKAVALSMAGYGTVQFALAELANLMPLNGAARQAAGLDFSFFVSLLRSATNAVGGIADDLLLPYCKHWFPISRSLGLDSQVCDPEALHRNMLEVTAGLRLANSHQLGNAFFSAAAARMTVLMAIAVFMSTLESFFNDSELGDDSQARALNVVQAGMLMLIYFPFVYVCSQRPVGAPVQLNEIMTP